MSTRSGLQTEVGIAIHEITRPETGTQVKPTKPGICGKDRQVLRARSGDAKATARDE